MCSFINKGHSKTVEVIGVICLKCPETDSYTIRDMSDMSVVLSYPYPAASKNMEDSIHTMVQLV